MEGAQHTVLVAALSTYADLLAKNTSDLSLEPKKGKGKASDDVVDIEAETQDQIKLCGDIIHAVTECDEKTGCRSGDNSPVDRPRRSRSARARRPSTTSLGAKRRSSKKYEYHDEEYVDPFTGLPAVLETGFEPGPSTRPPATLARLSRTEDHVAQSKKSHRPTEEKNSVTNSVNEAAANTSTTGSYFSQISTLSSKALKAAVSVFGMNQAESACVDPPLRAKSVAHASNRTRDESPPPAYETLARRPSVAPTAFGSNLKTKSKKERKSSITLDSDFTDDEELARRLQQEEYLEMQRERDLLLAHSLANGTADDGDIELANFMAREFEDLIATVGSTTGGLQADKKPPQVDLSHWDMDTQQTQLDLLYALELQNTLQTEDTSDDAGWAAAMRLQDEFDQEARNDEAWEEWKKTNIVECIVCGDEHHTEELLRPCEHGYCEGCLQAGFKNALDTKMPFKCCKKRLNVDECLGLGADFVTKYKALVLELTTKNPMYCCNASCAKFLPPQAIVGEVGTCKNCGTQTCRHCRKRIHPGVFCEEDQETKAVKELAMRKGWKTCPGCNHLIERSVGCLHMVCSRCQTAFCYRCSKRWNDCESTCPDPISATHPKFPTR